MCVHEKSNSMEQQEAEEIIFNTVKDWLGIDDLQKNPTIRLTNDLYPQIVPDFYSEPLRIVGEVFAHIGTPKRGQHNKIANDILKMLLLEKMKGHTYRKIIVVCDETEENSLLGKSSLAECIRQFGIEIKRVVLDDDTRSRILRAQERQIMVNG